MLPKDKPALPAVRATSFTLVLMFVCFAFSFFNRAYIPLHEADGGHVEEPMVFHQQCKQMTLSTKNAGDLVGVDGEVNVKSPIKLESCKGVFETLV